MILKRTALSALFGMFVLCTNILFAQAPQNGLKPSRAEVYALTNATVLVTPDKKLEGATIIIEGDKIVKIGTLVKVPNNAVEIDCSNKIIIPSFIELYSSIGLPSEKSESWSPGPQTESSKKGAYYWNESIRPETDAADVYVQDSKAEEDLISKGYGYALTHVQNGIARGRGAFVALGVHADDQSLTSWTKTSFYSFNKGTSRQSYPSSQMGSIALLRQAFYDAIWYKNAAPVEKNLSLEALNSQMGNVHFFNVEDHWEILRAQKIANEFKHTFHFVGSGSEYAIIDDLKKMKATLVIPIDFPAAYDVTNPYVARQIPLSDLKHWELAPKNPSILAQNGIPFCISSIGHKTAKEFWDHLRLAIQHGLSERDALAALTTQPAKLIGIDDETGTLDVGKKASFTIYDVNPFQEKATILESWVLGNRNVIATIPLEGIASTYNLLIDQRKFPLVIEDEGDQFKGRIHYPMTVVKEGITKVDTLKITPKILVSQNDITIQFAISDTLWKGSVNLRGKINTKLGVFEGEGMIPSGKWVKWSAVRNGKSKDVVKEKTPLKSLADTNAVVWFPNMAYGFDSIPTSENLIIENATIWTNESEGILTNASIVVQNGKITHCGAGSFSRPKNARVIDAKGMHVTSGIIDEHSHIAISKGVNEGGQAIAAEVSIGDVVHSDDINIYRQLSGGVTTAQLLHGSADPIGGQSALIKLKWGSMPEEMLIDDAPKFIKFALGENVKQSNWGSYNTVRFPQTRMGVEQVYYDGFSRARTYLDEKKRFVSGNLKVKPRVDLELEVLGEILQGNRFITCHSYVQSEINMLMHVADSMGFKINTFTHILEGYKLADKMAKHGAGASTFSDWWAYKYEVNEAIPYNAAMLHNQGVVVAINSDDAEMGRRLNQEAAKAVKYGGMSEENAWKMVTLNPARLLHLDDRIGSLKVGKDADIVIWSDNPLSIRAKVNYSIIEGVILYDAASQDYLQQRNAAERARIIAKMLEANSEGNNQEFVKKKKGHFHCNTLGEEASTEENHH